MNTGTRWAQHVSYTARGLRLHPALWEIIDREAKSLRLRPTDYLRRKIEDAFSFDRDLHDSHVDMLVTHETPSVEVSHAD